MGSAQPLNSCHEWHTPERVHLQWPEPAREDRGEREWCGDKHEAICVVSGRRAAVRRAGWEQRRDQTVLCSGRADRRHELLLYTRSLGSIHELTDNSGAVLARYDLDPYGRRTKVTGGVDADFGFTGHYHHQPSGLHLALYRGYDADLGRWISRDPIGENGGINLYAYVFNEPTRQRSSWTLS